MRRVEIYQRQVQVALQILDHCLQASPVRSPDLDDVAREAGASKFHFQRIFLALIGETPYNYFNNRRLRLAVEKLKNFSSSDRLIDLALELGYDSHSSFSRAFKARFGHVPLQIVSDPQLADKLNFRKPYSAHSRTDKLSFERIELERFFFAFNSSLGVKNGSFFFDLDIGEELERMLTETIGVPAAAFPTAPNGLNDPDTIAHYGVICAEKPSMQNREIALGNWARFLYFGDFKHIHMCWNRAYQTVISSSDLLLREEWPFEVYASKGDVDTRETCVAEIWLPVI